MAGVTAIYISSTSFSIIGDQTSIFNEGRRVRATCNSVYKYGTIESSSYSSLTTVVLTATSDALDSGLTEVYYGIQADVVGSLPTHAHDTTEGEGGTITLANLSDTPATYDTGKFLRSTSSGTEWATTSGGAGIDHAVLSNLAYASAGHTGFAETSHSHTESDISDLDKYTQNEVDTISGSLQTDIDTKVSNFIELSDTPSTYVGHTGKFLRVSTDETELEYSTISGTATTTISGWDTSGDIYYADFNHNLSTDEISVFIIDTITNKAVGAEDVEIINVNTIRVYISDNTSILKVNVITGGFGTGYVSFSPERMVYIAKNGSDESTDGARSNPFLTIQAGIDYLYTTYGPVTDDSNKVIVKIAPGKYTEQIHSYENIVITGYTSGYASVNTPPPATIYNTGADAATYPLRSDGDEVYNLVGINVETATSGTFGKLPFGNFNNCRLNDGHFIERDSSVLSIFSTCSFDGSSCGGFNLTGTNLTGFRNILFRGDCTFEGHGRPILTSTHTGFANFKWTGVNLGGSILIGGDWDWRVDKSYVYRVATRNTIDTTGLINIVDSTIINGLHFSSAPESFKMINSSFEGISDNKIPDGECDITSDVTISGAMYANNTQHNGICGDIHIINKQKNVGCCSLDGYSTLQDAVDSVETKGIVELHSDLDSLEKLTISGTKNITIRGKKTYSLAFTGDVVTLEPNQELYFNEINTLTGEEFDINGDNAILSFEGCLTVNGYITTTSGTDSFFVSYFSSLRSIADHPTLTINNTDTLCVSGYSRLKGYTGQPAIVFNVDADDKLKVKYSTLLHGDGSTNIPIINSSGAKIDIAIYSSAMNAAFSTADFTNSIGSPNNTVSNELNF